MSCMSESYVPSWISWNIFTIADSHAGIYVNYLMCPSVSEGFHRCPYDNTMDFEVFWLVGVWFISSCGDAQHSFFYMKTVF